MEGVDVLQYTRVNEADNVKVDVDFKKDQAKKLRLTPASQSLSRLKSSGAFTMGAVRDFNTQAATTSVSEPKVLTIHAAPEIPRGVTVAQHYADGSTGVAVKVGETAWRTFSIPLHVREALFRLDRSAGAVPLGSELRLSNTSVTLLVLYRCVLFSSQLLRLTLAPG